MHRYLEHVSLSLSEKENGSKLFQQIIHQLAKILKKENTDVLQAYRNLQGYQSVTVEEEQDDTIISRLKTLETSKKEHLPAVRLIVEKGHRTFISYSLIGGEFTKKTHETLHPFDHGFFRVVDPTRFLAEAILLNELQDFIQENEGLVRYLVCVHVTKHSQDATLLPIDGKFSYDLLQSLKSFGLLQSTTLKNPLVDHYKFIFYLDKNDNGTLQGLEHPLLQDILVPEFVRQMMHVKEERVRRKKEQSSYSHSFQTKKNIKKANQFKMKDNAFLTHYGFVEIDNKVSLEDFEKWESAFEQFKRELPIPIMQDHSLRIRRLGKQKATGMYYPSFRSTVIDIDAPSSYGHELGHQIDYSGSSNRKNLSDALTFRPLMDQYKELVEKEIVTLDENDAFRKQWTGKGKYNQSYYTTPTEVFARCFELYLETKGITSLLTKEKLQGVVYPKEKEFLENISRYFDTLFY